MRLAVYLHDTAGALGAAVQAKGDHFLIGGVVDPVQHDERAVDFLYAGIFYYHNVSLPETAREMCAVIYC